MGNIKEINIKNRTYYFFDDMINIRNFDPSLLKIDKNSYKRIGIYNIILYSTMKNSYHVKINSVNPLYINKKLLEKYTRLWGEIKYDIKTINGGECHSVYCYSIESGECNSIEYEKDYMKIKFNSDDNLSLNKILKLHNLKIIVRSVFEEDGKYYPQVFLDEYVYES